MTSPHKPEYTPSTGQYFSPAHYVCSARMLDLTAANRILHPDGPLEFVGFW